MGAEVTLLGRMIFRVNKDGIVRTRCHASLAADANRFIKINNTVGAFEHRGCRASHYARRVGALIATGDLMRATNLREDSDVNVLHVGSRDRKRNKIFRLACRRARMTTDAPGMVDYLGPLHRSAFWFFEHEGSELRFRRGQTISCGVEKKTRSF